MWGGEANQANCFAPNSNEATRGDFMIASPLWSKAISSFRVTSCDNFPVHQPIDMVVNLVGSEAAFSWSDPLNLIALISFAASLVPPPAWASLSCLSQWRPPWA